MKENSREPTKIIIIACACGIMKIRRKRESCDDYTTTTACWANTTPDHCPSPRDVSSARARSRGARPALKYIKVCVGVRKVHSKICHHLQCARVYVRWCRKRQVWHVERKERYTLVVVEGGKIIKKTRR